LSLKPAFNVVGCFNCPYLSLYQRGVLACSVVSHWQP